MNIDLKSASASLAGKSADEIINWALSNNGKNVVSTHFGPHEAVLLHMLTQRTEQLKVLWVDHGYNTKETYRFAEKLIEKLKLDVDVFTPRMSVARVEAVYAGVPDVEDPRHKTFTEQFKLEPFERAFKELQPEVWFTAIRKEQTPFREGLTPISQGPHGCIKVAPLLAWNEKEMNDYLASNDLPNEEYYYDPTKVLAHRECGLHTRLGQE